MVKLARFPQWWQAPEEILDIDGPCGLVAVWAVLHYFGEKVEVSQIVKSCRYTKGKGVHTVDLAAALREHGLHASFHSELDEDISRFEKTGYNRARRFGVDIKPAVDLTHLLRERRRGRIPIVLFNNDGSDSAHFSPLLGRRNGLLRLPYAKREAMPTDEFLTAWSGAGILRQCVIAGR
jgi:hypothetical protein